MTTYIRTSRTKQLTTVKVGKQLPPARAMAAEMSIVHNSLIRGINSVYNQCVNVSARGSNKDKVDFANYAFQWTEWVHEHHNLEEESLFPQINELAGVPGLMDANVNEHAGFHDGIIEYAEYLKNVKEEKQELSGETVKSFIDAFMPTLHTHLVNEIDTLVTLEKYDDKVNWIQWFNKEVDKMIKSFMAEYDYRVSFSVGRTRKGKRILLTRHGGIFRSKCFHWASSCMINHSRVVCGRPSLRFHIGLRCSCAGSICTRRWTGGGLLAVISLHSPRSCHLPSSRFIGSRTQ